MKWRVTKQLTKLSRYWTFGANIGSGWGAYYISFSFAHWVLRWDLFQVQDDSEEAF